MTSYQADFASHRTFDRHVGFLFAWCGIGKHKKMTRNYQLNSYHNTKITSSEKNKSTYSRLKLNFCHEGIQKKKGSLVFCFPQYHAVRTYTRTILPCLVVSFLHCAVLRKTTKHPFIVEFLHVRNYNFNRVCVLLFLSLYVILVLWYELN